MKKILGKIAAVTGAGRGLGLGTAQSLAKDGYHVILLGRNMEKLSGLAKEMNGTAIELDLLQIKSIENAAKEIAALCPEGLDLLVNNAGVLLDRDSWNYEDAQKTMITNALAPLHFSKLLAPLLEKRLGRIVNVSSGMGQLSEMGGGYAAYRLSKSALNAATRNLAQDYRGKIKVNSVCPGWVKTDMGGAGAERELSEGVASIIFATRTEETGGFFRDGKRLDW